MTLLITILSLSATDFSYLTLRDTFRCKLTCDGATTRLLTGISCLEGMTYTAFIDDDTYRPELPGLWEQTPSYASTPGYFGRECTPSVFCPEVVNCCKGRKKCSYKSYLQSLLRLQRYVQAVSALDC